MIKLAVLLLCCCVGLSGCSMSLQGDNGLTVAGNSTSTTVTLGLDGTVAREIGTDSGMAVPGSNTFYILGSGNVTTSGSGNTVTILGSGGPPGPVGPQGIQGTTGPKGDTGATGLVGNITTNSGTLTNQVNISILGSGDIATSASGDTVTITGLLTNKVVYYSRVLTAASGNVSYTGIGFQPRGLIIQAAENSVNAATHRSSLGFSDSAKNNMLFALSAGTQYLEISAILSVGDLGISYQTASLVSYDADGFTLAWTKFGSPTGTGYLVVYAER